jgi:hypothetical protein
LKGDLGLRAGLIKCWQTAVRTKELDNALRACGEREVGTAGDKVRWQHAPRRQITRGFQGVPSIRKMSPIAELYLGRSGSPR